MLDICGGEALDFSECMDCRTYDSTLQSQPAKYTHQTFQYCCWNKFYFRYVCSFVCVKSVLYFLHFKTTMIHNNTSQFYKNVKVTSVCSWISWHIVTSFGRSVQTVHLIMFLQAFISFSSFCIVVSPVSEVSSAIWLFNSISSSSSFFRELLHDTHQHS